MHSRAFAAQLYEFLRDNNDNSGFFVSEPRENCIEVLESYLSDLEMVEATISDIEEIADEFDDEDVYAEKVAPLLRGLREIQERLTPERDKRMVSNTGYEVTFSLHIGDHEILFAEDAKSRDGNCYLVTDYKEHGIISEYYNSLAGDNYLEMMAEFTERVNDTIDVVRDEISQTDFQAEPITAADCHPHDYEQDLNGKVIAIKTDVLRHEYRRGDRQLVLVGGGFGANANARGSAVYCYHLYNGEQTRFERQDVLGIVKNIPKWAQERLAVIQAERGAKEQPTPAAPEMCAGYTITERIRVGDMQYVLGERAESGDYVTWQHMDGREGYDHGHYYKDKQKALADLQRRADKERDNQAPDRNKRNRDDAR